MTTATPYGTLPPASPVAARKPVSLPRLAEMRERGEKITMLTAYDATFAAVANAAGVECILVGDSLGMVCQGLSSTVGVTLETMCYHTESVARGIRRVQGTCWIIGDLPFGSYQESREQALRSAKYREGAGDEWVRIAGIKIVAAERYQRADTSVAGQALKLLSAQPGRRADRRLGHAEVPAQGLPRPPGPACPVRSHPERQCARGDGQRGAACRSLERERASDRRRRLGAAARDRQRDRPDPRHRGQPR